MTQQFKFGDMVRHPDFETPCVFIRQYYDAETGEKTWAEVFNDDECETQTRMVTHENLELIPHPDTVRLERVGRLAVEAMGMKFDLDEYRRQIDATMQAQPEEE